MVQTMTPEHPVIKLAARQDYDAFYEMEIAIRELHHCPPFLDLFFITVHRALRGPGRAGSKAVS